MEKTAEQTSFFKKAFVFCARVFRFLFLLSVVLSVVLFFIAQTDTFRNWAKLKLLEVANDNLLGKIEFGSVSIDLYHGVSLNDFRVLAENDTVVSCKALRVHYSLESLYFRSVAIESLILVEPKVKILRSKQDSIWNIEKIAKPSIDTTANEPIDWYVAVRDIQITNGMIAFVDSLSMGYQQPGNVDYLHMVFDNLQFRSAFYGQPTLQKFTLALHTLSLTERNTQFKLNSLSGICTFDSTGVETYGLEVITPTTEFTLVAKWKNINFFSLTNEMLFTAPFEAVLDATKASAHDARFFIPPVFIVGGDVTNVRAKASGSLRNMDVNYLEVSTKKSNVHIFGTLRNLDKAESFIYDVSMENSVGDYDEISSYLPTVSMPKLPFIGTSKVRNAHVLGSITYADATFDGVAECGTFKGELGSNFDPKKKLTYYVKGELTKFDLHKVLPTIEQAERTILSGIIDIKGEGVTVPDLVTTVQADLSASTISGIPLEECILRMHSEKGSRFYLDTLAVRFKRVTEFAPENQLLESELKKGFSLFANGNIYLSDLNNPRYLLECKTTNFQLAHLLKLPDLPEYISTEFRLVGHGFDPDSIEVSVLNAKIQFCYINQTSIKPFVIQRFQLGFQNNERNLDFRSDYFSLLVKGQYRFEPLIAILQQHIADITQFIQQKTTFIFDGSEPIGYDTLLYSRKLVTEPTSAYVFLDVKQNIVPILASYLHIPFEELQCRLYLTIDSKDNQTILNVLPSTSIERCILASDSSYFFVEKVTISSSSISSPYDRIDPIKKFQASFFSDSSIILNTIEFKHPSTAVSYTEKKTTYNVAAEIVSIGSFSIEGSILTLPNSYEFYIDSLGFDYTDKLFWHLKEPFQIHLKNKLFTIDSAIIVRSKAEEIRIAGSLDLEEFHNFTVDISSFPLSEIPQLIPDKKLFENLKTIKGNVDRLLVTLNKKFTDPSIEFVGSFSSLEFNEVKLGFANLDIAYAQSTVTGVFDLYNKRQNTIKRYLEITIDTLPLNIGFSESKAFIIEDKPIRMSAKMSALPLAIVSPFIPSIQNLTGTAKLDLEINGPNFNSIQYTGIAKGNNIRFVSLSNNMEYLAEASARIFNNKVYVDTAIVRNNPIDLLNGRADITGELTIKDLNIDSFNLDITSKQIAILSDDSRGSALGMYGPFVIGTSSEPLKFSGTFASPNLVGPVLVKYGNIVVVPKIKNINAVSEFEYIILDTLQRLDDSTTFFNDSTALQKPKYTRFTNTEQKSTPDDLPQLSKSPSSLGAQKAFADLIKMDLKVDIIGDFTVTMDLTTPGMLIPTSLVARIAPGKLVYKQEDNKPKLWGTMKLRDGSTYSFYRPFIATGTLEFNEEMYNPSLNLTAITSGTRYYNERNQSYSIRMDITGTQTYPEIEFFLTIDGQDQIGEQDKIKGDAIMMILLGRTQRELGSQTASAGTDIASTSFAAILSKLASDFLQGSNVIQSFDLQFQNGNTSIDNAQVQVGGNLISDVNWRFSGTLADLSTNSLITIEFPLAALIDKDYFQNVVFQFTRSANTVTSVNRQQKEWELKMFVRKIF